MGHRTGQHQDGQLWRATAAAATVRFVDGLDPIGATGTGHRPAAGDLPADRRNTLPGWLLEPIGLYVSLLNNCVYCVDHHAVGLAREPADQGAADAIVSAQRDAAATGADVWASLATRNGSYFATRAGSPSIP